MLKVHVTFLQPCSHKSSHKLRTERRTGRWNRGRVRRGPGAYHKYGDLMPLRLCVRARAQYRLGHADSCRGKRGAACCAPAIHMSLRHAGPDLQSAGRWQLQRPQHGRRCHLLHVNVILAASDAGQREIFSKLRRAALWFAQREYPTLILLSAGASPLRLLPTAAQRIQCRHPGLLLSSRAIILPVACRGPKSNLAESRRDCFISPLALRHNVRRSCCSPSWRVPVLSLYALPTAPKKAIPAPRRAAQLTSTPMHSLSPDERS